MTVEEIAIRQEVRQLLNEAGINKNTMKQIVKEVIDEELNKAVRQVMHEMNLDDEIRVRTNGNLQEVVRKEIKNSIDQRVKGVFDRMYISVDVRNIKGESVLETAKQEG